MRSALHVVEPGGRGGVYQHAASLAAAAADLGVPVVLHSAADAEEVPGLGDRVLRHSCFWRFDGLRPTLLRWVALTCGWGFIGVPSCLARLRPGDIVHVEGWFRPVLFLPLVLGARIRRARVVLAPHNTFSRRGRGGEERLVRWMSRRVDAVLVFCERDRRRAESWGATTVVVPMMVGSSPVDPALVAWWRARWGAIDGQPVVLLAGQLRRDKGPDLLVRAAERWDGRLVPALVGEDLGALGPARRLAAELGVPLRATDGYLPIRQFVAALCAADVVVCPHRVSSQSGVLALGAALGLRTVATDVGGLPELATVVVRPDDPRALAEAVERVLDRDRPPARPPADLRPYLDTWFHRQGVGR